MHYKTHFSELHPDKGMFQIALDMVHLQAHFLRMGNVVAVRNDNPHCRHSTELALVRAACPPDHDNTSTDVQDYEAVRYCVVVVVGLSLGIRGRELLVLARTLSLWILFCL